MPAATHKLPLSDYAATQTRRQTKVPQGLDAVAHWIAGGFRRQRVDFSELTKEAARIHEMAATFRSLNKDHLAEQLVARHRKARLSLRRGLPIDERRHTVALLVETMRRSTGLAPYPEQILGALVMEKGGLAEMATGEGKTLTIGLSAAFLSWKGRPCHVVTANDYLVERDAETLRDFYQRCGLSVGAVTATQPPAQRKTSYEADITYVTSKEVVADFLRDRLVLQDWIHPTRRLIQRFLRPRRDPRDQTVTRGLHSAIIDEADHVLIDEAVTPLIISRPIDNVELDEACRKAAQLAGTLEANTHFERFPRFRDIELKPAGKKILETACATFPAIWRSPARAEELIRQALVAREFYKRDEQYVLTEENKIAIVDESTGRLMPERTWRQGLHQAIEAKEGLELTRPSETLSRLSFQRFFRYYHHLCGCTGTAREASGEFWHIYRLPVFQVSTHQPCIRKELPPLFFPTASAKRNAIVAAVAAAHALRQPVLVGTRSVEESETLAGLFAKQGMLAVRVLNASRHKHEAGIVAEAGHHGALTIATNMAGRGTDIKLRDGVQALGGLFVIISEMHGSARIDRQLAGRCARQGEPGTTQLFASFEDDLAVRFLPKGLQVCGKWLLRSRLPASHRAARLLLELAQRRATSQAFRERKQVPRQDEWLSESLAFAGKDPGG